MSNLRDATVVGPPSLIKKKKNGADKYIFAPIIGMGGSIEILQVQRLGKKNSASLNSPDRYGLPRYASTWYKD